LKGRENSEDMGQMETNIKIDIKGTDLKDFSWSL
jgi:hypothetical protein